MWNTCHRLVAVAVCASISIGCAADVAPEDATARRQPDVFPGPSEPSSICAPTSGGFTTTVTNPYVPLVVCSRRVLAGVENGVKVAVQITVLDETRVIAGVETRVVEEYETEDGEVVEISYNYFVQAEGGSVPSGATSPRDGTVCYFGEDVDIFNEDGTVTHEGAWLAGVNGAQPGIIMPGVVEDGQAYLQEIAPGVAEDRAWHTQLAHHRLFVTEDTPLEPGTLSHKVYLEGTGLIRDGKVKLVSYELLEPDECQRTTPDPD